MINPGAVPRTALSHTSDMADVSPSSNNKTSFLALNMKADFVRLAWSLHRAKQFCGASYWHFSLHYNGHVYHSIRDLHLQNLHCPLNCQDGRYVASHRHIDYSTDDTLRDTLLVNDLDHFYHSFHDLWYEAPPICSTVRCRMRSCGINRTTSTISSLTCERIQSSHDCRLDTTTEDRHSQVHQSIPFQTCCHRVCRRRNILSLTTRILDRDFLITNANVKIIIADVDSTCNVRTLLVDWDQHFTILIIQPLLSRLLTSPKRRTQGSRAHSLQTPTPLAEHSLVTVRACSQRRP